MLGIGAEIGALLSSCQQGLGTYLLNPNANHTDERLLAVTIPLNLGLQICIYSLGAILISLVAEN